MGGTHEWTGGYGEISPGATGDIARRLTSIQKLSAEKKNIKIILDIGSESGAMLDFLATKFKSYGLESKINARKECAQKSYEMFSAIDKVKE